MAKSFAELKHPESQQKIGKLDRRVHERMHAMLERGSARPDAWHKIDKVDTARRAAEQLAAQGLIEIWNETELYRLKPGPWVAEPKDIKSVGPRGITTTIFVPK